LIAKVNMTFHWKKYWPEFVFFALLLVIGLFSHWGKTTLGEWGIQKHYLNAEGLPIIPRKFLNSANLCFLFFWIATVFTYLFSYEIFNNRKWAMLTVSMWVCFPALVGIAFFDVPNIHLLAFMMMGCYLFIRLVKRPTYLTALLLALSHTLAIWAHPIAICLPLVSLCFFALNLFTRNIPLKNIGHGLSYILGLLVFLMIGRWGIHFTSSGPILDFLPSTYYIAWYHKIFWLLKVTPPLWMIYFLFGLVALNLVYFSNYFAFLKSKWMYSYLFIIMICFFVAPYFLPTHLFFLQNRYFFLLPSLTILGIAGCYEFAQWVRNRWGERTYFIFKYSFIAVFMLQCLWSVIAMVWLHPDYFRYTNWPLFFM
jgi:hypothetical protein